MDSIESNEIRSSKICSAKGEFDGVCLNPQIASAKYGNGIDKKQLTLAAKYYRKAAEEHGSERANFNLGFMHEYIHAYGII